MEYFNSAPTNMLFVYWPKSTWKTTLIKKVIKENLATEKYDINYLNLRNVLLRNFTDFKNLFFPENLKWKTKKLLWTIWEIWAFWLKWNPGEEHIMETNIFWLMEDKFSLITFFISVVFPVLFGQYTNKIFLGILLK